MKHRDGSGTFVPTDGTYIPRGHRDSNSKLPVLTMEERIKEHEEVKKEYREYQVRPVKYWNGTPQTGGGSHSLAWLFPMYSPLFFSIRFGYLCTHFSCDCCDRYSAYDDYYLDYDDDSYGYGYDYENDYEDMAYEEYEGYGHYCDEEENYSDEEEDHSDVDRRSPSLDGHESTTKSEDDKADVKREIGEEIRDGPVIIPKLEEYSASSVPGAIPQPVVTGSGAEESAPRSSKIGPNIETEVKRVSAFRPFWSLPEFVVSRGLS